jgi:hypothetical protein
MTTFNDRERAFESKFALDEAQEFKAMSRRNKMLGLWAGELLGKDGQELDAYVAEVVRSDFKEAGDDDVARKVAADLGGRADAAAVRVKMDELMQTARAQVAGGQ